MNVLNIKINGKTYTTAKITAYNARQALKIQQENFELGKNAEQVYESKGEGVLSEAGTLLADILELRDKKSLLLVDIYGGKFTIEELERELSDDEIDTEINRIISGISGVIEKN